MVQQYHFDANVTAQCELVAPQGEPASLRVIVVDQSDGCRVRLRESFRSLGYEVLEASGARDAHAIAERVSIDLAVAELVLPDEQGLSLLGDLRALTPALKTAIVTHCPSIATAVRATRYGIDAYLSKPATATHVLNAVAEGAGNRSEVAWGLNEASWMTLERAKWEYIQSAVVEADSLSEAARRLGVAPRSLRRMLAKKPPRR